MKMTPNLARVAHMPVKTVVNSPGPAAKELLDIVAKSNPSGKWRIADWHAKLDQLDAETRTVEEFLS